MVKHVYAVVEMADHHHAATTVDNFAVKQCLHIPRLLLLDPNPAVHAAAANFPPNLLEERELVNGE